LVNLVVIKRPGHIWEQVNGIDNIIFIEGPIIDISGTEIRTRVSEISSLKGMIPKDVENYIYQHKLYSSKDHYG
jgi:nicotinate-nucleotide adenylyltransferase